MATASRPTLLGRRIQAIADNRVAQAVAAL